jgi:hypothetical protein
MLRGAADAWNWLTMTDAGLALRVGVGVAIFAALALADLRCKGRDATRWKEYAFLAGAAAAAMAYGAINDQITCRISWEYFWYGKGLDAVLRTPQPAGGGELSWEATKIGLKTAWTVGLVMGAALLVANNPSARRRQLPYRALAARLAWVALSCVAFAALLGALGYAGCLVGVSADFRDLVRNDQFRPYRFMAVYGIHLGAYVGGALGTVAAVISVRRRRAVLAG